MRGLVGVALGCAVGVLSLVACDSSSGAGGDGGAGGAGGTDTEFPCTERGIRDAIALGGGPNTFDCDATQPVLTTSEIVIDNDVVLDGEGELVVDGGRDHRVFSVPEGSTVELRGLTITRGRAPSERDGGAILNQGKLVLVDSVFDGNLADGTGGALHSSGADAELSVTDCTISDNYANFGAGIYSDGTLVLTNTTIANNEAAQFGGGVYGAGVQTWTGTTVSGNTATFFSGGGLYADGIVDLNLAPLADNGGPTETHALRTEPVESVAIDAIPTPSCASSVDQRGVTRPQGAGCDIGAFER